MNSTLSSRLVQLDASLGRCVSFLQRQSMKAAVAVSLKLCWFTARVLLNGSARSRAGSAL
ncbi:MAG: hypothetical protein WA949_19790 [Phormidesmis sp.]